MQEKKSGAFCASRRQRLRALSDDACQQPDHAATVIGNLRDLDFLSRLFDL
jgi:hypothetical protein